MTSSDFDHAHGALEKLAHDAASQLFASMRIPDIADITSLIVHCCKRWEVSESNPITLKQGWQASKESSPAPHYVLQAITDLTDLANGMAHIARCQESEGEAVRDPDCCYRCYLEQIIYALAASSKGTQDEEFKRQHLEGQLHNCNALIRQIQHIVGEAFGPEERYSDFDVLDQGVALLAEGYKNGLSASKVESPEPDELEFLRQQIKAYEAQIKCADKYFAELAVEIVDIREKLAALSTLGTQTEQEKG